MKRKTTKTGSITKFEHVVHNPKIEKLKSGELKLIIVYFDGEPDLWGCSDFDQAFAELELYYRIDWRGTNRVLPVLMFDPPEHKAIIC